MVDGAWFVVEGIIWLIAVIVAVVGILNLTRRLEDSKRKQAGRESLRWVSVGIVLAIVDDTWNVGDRYSTLGLLLVITYLGLTLVEYQILKDKELDEEVEDSDSAV